MNKIKVLTLISHMNDGGAQRLVLNYLKEFKDDKDIDFAVLCYDKFMDSYCNKEIKKNNYKVFYLNNKKSWFYFPGLRKLRLKLNKKVAQKEIKKFLLEYKPDIVHVHIDAFLNFCLKPIVECNISVRFDTMHSNVYRFNGDELKAIKSAFNEYNFIPICLTDEQGKDAKKYYDINTYEIVHNGIDFHNIKKNIISKKAARKQLNIFNDTFVVLAVGRLHEIKRLDILINSFSEVLKINNNSLLLIAGDGNKKKELQQLCEKLNISDRVKFLGNVDNTTKLYCAADVLALTSESEASPLVLIEASICGTRCVISSGVPDEVIVSDTMKKMKKNASFKDWANALLDEDYKGSKVTDLNTYELGVAIKNMKNLYLKYWSEYNDKK